VNRCPWSDTCPAGLAEAAEGWGMGKLDEVFRRAHARIKNHDDGTGRCRVCGGPIDFEAWLDEQDGLEKELS
jgi:hypothetical protein